MYQHSHYSHPHTLHLQQGCPELSLINQLDKPRKPTRLAAPGVAPRGTAWRASHKYRSGLHHDSIEGLGGRRLGGLALGLERGLLLELFLRVELGRLLIVLVGVRDPAELRLDERAALVLGLEVPGEGEGEG